MQSVIDISNITFFQGGFYYPGVLNIDLASFFKSILFIFFFIILIRSFSLNKKNFKFSRSIMIFLYHYLFVIFYVYITATTATSDSTTYFQQGMWYDNLERENSMNQAVLMRVVNILTRYFYVDYLSINILFGSFGGLGLALLDYMLQSRLKDSNNILKYLATGLVLLPGINLWTSSLGKDAITFFCLVAIFYLAVFQKKNLIIILILISTIFIMRPHIATCILAGVLADKIWSFRCSFLFKVIFLFFAASVTLVVFTKLIGLKNSNYFNLIEIYDYVMAASSMQKMYFVDRPGFIDSREFNIFKVVFYFHFYPLFDFSSLRNFYISVENLFLFGTILYLLSKISYKNFLDNHAVLFLSYVILSSIVLSLFIADLGIIWRQKWMTTTFLLLFLFNKIPFQKNKSK